MDGVSRPQRPSEIVHGEQSTRGWFLHAQQMTEVSPRKTHTRRTGTVFIEGTRVTPKFSVPEVDATLIGQNLFVWGGEDATGPTTQILRGDVSTAKETLGQVTRWARPPASSAAQQNLPAAHAGAFGWVANGNLYYAGGEAANGEVVWAIPDAAGNIPGWKHLAASDLPPDLQLRMAAPIVSGSHAFLVGGLTKDGPTTGTARANLAPKLPFFQLGLFYIVVPAMGIQGEVGQQLSYLVAAGVATGNFVLLLLIGYAFNHKERTRAFLHDLRNRRRRTA